MKGGQSWKGIGADIEKVDWNIDCTQVQDFNNELEQKLLTIINNLIPVKKITEKVKRIFESKEVWLLRKKRRNVFRNARRRESARLFLSIV